MLVSPHQFRAVIAASAASAVALGGGLAALPAQGRVASKPKAGFTSHVFATAAGLKTVRPPGLKTLSTPDDITFLSGRIYVAFQNGVGPQGQASPSGVKDSTVVAFSRQGRVLASWDLVGKCDGLTADPALHRVIATINEDAHSSLYLINPAAGATHFHYTAPLTSRGGTDAITIYHRLVLISASAPGTTGKAAPRAAYPAVYRASFHAAKHSVSLRPLFYDEARAKVANLTGASQGKVVKLGLTDPDSNEAVPAYAQRFAGDFMETSQGDEEQIFVRAAGTARQSLEVLRLSSSVDDTAWPSDSTGTLYTTDNGNGTIYRITGPFVRGSEVVADTPCDENSAPSTCPGPGFPANFLGQVDVKSGAISPLPVPGAKPEPQGLLFLP